MYVNLVPQVSSRVSKGQRPFFISWSPSAQGWRRNRTLLRPPLAIYFSLHIREFKQERTFVSVINVNKPSFIHRLYATTLHNVREFLPEGNLYLTSVGEPSGESGGLEGTCDSVSQSSDTKKVTVGNPLLKTIPNISVYIRENHESKECGRTSLRVFTNQHQRIHPRVKSSVDGDTVGRGSGHSSCLWCSLPLDPFPS